VPEFLFLNGFQWNFSFDCMWAAFCFTVAGYFGYRLRFDPYDARPATRMARGIVLVSLFSGLIRAFWAYVWYVRGVEGFAAPEVAFLLGIAPYVSLFEVGICLGYTIHLSHLAKRVFGRHWLWMPTVMTFVASATLAKIVIPG